MKNFIFSAWLIFFAMIPSMCKKEGSSVTVAVNSISPSSGIQLVTVKIAGSEFATLLLENEVKFNGVPAFVYDKVNDTLIVEVPKGAGTGPVTVTVNGKTAVGPVFTYELSATVSTLAGKGLQGEEDGPGVNASFNRPEGITTDAQGNLYISDTYNHRIRKVTPSGAVSTIVGRFEGNEEGPFNIAQFRFPLALAIDDAGKIYVADMYNHRIRIIEGNSVRTLAGSDPGFADGENQLAKFLFPTGIAIDKNGVVYVADNGNHRIRKITAQGNVTTVSGSDRGFQNGSHADAKFDHPFGIAVNSEGTIYVTEKANHTVRKITGTSVETLAGNGNPGFKDGIGQETRFFSPSQIAIHPSGDLYVADTDNHLIRKITPGGAVSTAAGKVKGFKDGIGDDALFTFPMAVGAGKNGIIYVADKENRIRKIMIE